MAKANYDLPEDKLLKVKRLSGAKSKREALIITMDEFLRKKALEELIKAPGKIRLRWTQKSLRDYRG